MKKNSFISTLITWSFLSLFSYAENEKQNIPSCPKNHIKGVSSGENFHKTFCFTKQELKSMSSYITNSDQCYEDKDNPEYSFQKTAEINRLEADITNLNEEVSRLTSEFNEDKKNLALKRKIYPIDEMLIKNMLDTADAALKEAPVTVKMLLQAIEKLNQMKEEDQRYEDLVNEIDFLESSLELSQKQMNSNLFLKIKRDYILNDDFKKIYEVIYFESLKENVSYKIISDTMDDYINLKEEYLRKLISYQEKLKSQKLTFCEKQEKTLVFSD